MEDTAPKHFHEERKKAWNAIPYHAEDVRQRIEKELNVPATISKSENGFGRSWYVRPQIYSNDENPFVVRVSDHDANQRLHQMEARINLMHSGPGFRVGTEPMRSDDDIEQQKNNAIEFAKKYAERNKFKGGGYIHKEDGGPITAYHGSPHDFEQFDTSKIGTGEGNQSYGHGLYFAEHEPVAKGYAKEIAKQQHVDPSMHFDGGIIYQGQELNDLTPVQIAAHVVADNGIDTAHKLMSEWSQDYYSGPMWKSALQALQENPNKFANAKWKHGHMYEVTIDAHPDHFLDWDKDLEEQTLHIQNALNKLAALDEKEYGEGGGLSYYTSDPASHSGSDIVKYLQDQHEGQEAANILHKAGIKGVKYFDRQSRKEGEGSRNYVVFDHNDVNIKRKYEQGGFVNGYNDGGTTHEPHKRAEEQGYSIKGYHFTRGPKAQSIAKSKQFDPYLSEGGEHATFFWDNPQAANDWAHFAGGVDPNKPQEKMTPYELDRLSRFAPSMLPVRIHPGKHTVVNWPEATGSHRYDNNAMKKLIQNARNEGYDTVRIKNMIEGDMDSELGRNLSQPYDQIAVLNPNVIRSEFAQFDPARQHENDIGARKGGTVNREKIDYKNTLHSPIVKHVLDKISAPLPALDPHLLAAIAGRRS